ncbi:MAG: FAD-dependent oxidoreductase [Myxococcota bacterium]
MRPRSVVVVGAGPAGMGAATVLAERGVAVTLVEREAFVGGRAAAWLDRLKDGTPFHMQRGIHTFPRHHYNVRALLRRVDPRLSSLVRLEDRLLLGPHGMEESFGKLPALPPFNVVSLLRRTPALRTRKLLRVNLRATLEMLRYDPERTYTLFDKLSAAEYLDSLRLPHDVREVLFTPIARTLFHAEDTLSAAELLLAIHAQILANAEGMVPDVMKVPLSTALWEPLLRYLEQCGATFRPSTTVRAVEGGTDGGWRTVLSDGDVIPSDGVVLATTVPALKAIVHTSPALGDADWRDDVMHGEVTSGYAAWWLWLDQPVSATRPAYAQTTGFGILDAILLPHWFSDESAHWAARTGGSVVALHAYAVPRSMDEAEAKREMLEALFGLYPELRGARVLDERYVVGHDAPAFPPGSIEHRLRVSTPSVGVTVAGDHVAMALPTAVMERAVTSGIMAANHLLNLWGVREEIVWSVPARGLFPRGVMG